MGANLRLSAYLNKYRISNICEHNAFATVRKNLIKLHLLTCTATKCHEMWWWKLVSLNTSAFTPVKKFIFLKAIHVVKGELEMKSQACKVSAARRNQKAKFQFAEILKSKLQADHQLTSGERFSPPQRLSPEIPIKIAIIKNRKRVGDIIHERCSFPSLRHHHDPWAFFFFLPASLRHKTLKN